jgi:transaldolase/glucose-6-phosphate isomerase
MKHSLPTAIRREVKLHIADWNEAGKIARLWAKDASVWTNDDEAKWLGWLNIVGEELADTEKYSNLSEDIKNAEFADVLLMGMGGSSLGPEVLAMTFGKTNFHILDSTVPSQVKAVEDRLDLSKTLFIVASKSGTTLEPNCFKQYFFDRLSALVGRENAGRQFIAITDPGSKMEQVARDNGFRHIFFGKSEIGGRFSALSAFGMTAAASMGLDVEGFLSTANTMVDACRSNDAGENPGALLGIILGICHKHGRDKLTIFSSPEIQDLGAWLEQLIAESTGKNGVAIIPIDKEPVLSPAFRRQIVGGEPPEGATQNYSDDRVFVFLSLKGSGDFEIPIEAIAAAGHPVIGIELEGIQSLGQEFFRWEFATAVVGSVMNINPFNQPDVESAKIEARKITDEYEQTGSLPGENPFLTGDGMALYTSEEYASLLNGAATETTIRGLLNAHLSQLSPGDYFALLAYIEMNETNEKLLTWIRTSVLECQGNATCLGFGPRFLHSTGQAYKGGANNGVFLQITADDPNDLQVPGQKYTFGVVKAAQSRGDFQVLLDRGRRSLRVHIMGDVTKGLEKLAHLFG